MFNLSFGNKKNSQLEDIIAKLESNMANNYKDAAQADFRELERVYEELVSGGKLSDKQKSQYESIVEGFREKLKKYSHKDQKPYWTR